MWKRLVVCFVCYFGLVGPTVKEWQKALVAQKWRPGAIKVISPLIPDYWWSFPTMMMMIIIRFFGSEQLVLIRCDMSEIQDSLRGALHFESLQKRSKNWDRADDKSQLFLKQECQHGVCLTRIINIFSIFFFKLINLWILHHKFLPWCHCFYYFEYI